MANILVSSSPRTRRWLVSMLSDEHDVSESKGGRDTLERVCSEQPELVLVEEAMPGMTGFDILEALKKNPDTGDIPVIILGDTSRGESNAAKLGATNFLVKPLDPGMVGTVIRSAPRDSDGRSARPPARAPSPVEEEPSHDDVFDEAPPVENGYVPGVARTGIRPLDQLLKGGIPFGSLTMIEGTPSSGKSVLCQHIAYECLQDGQGVVYYTSESTMNSFITQMGSLGMDVTQYLRDESFRLCPLEKNSAADPEAVLGWLVQQLEEQPKQYKVAIIDSVSNLARGTQDSHLMRFFADCEAMCRGGKTIIPVAHSHMFDQSMLMRLHSLCNAHLSLHDENIGQKVAKAVEVRKSRNLEGRSGSGNLVLFDVKGGIGISVIPGTKVRI